MIPAIDQNEGIKLGTPGAPMVYRCHVKTAGGRVTFVDVIAATGDEAGLEALKEYPDAFVTNITPAPQSAQEAPKKAA